MNPFFHRIRNLFIPFKTPLAPIDIAFSGNHGYPVEFLFEFDYALEEDKLFKTLNSSLRNFPVLKTRMKTHPTHGYVLHGNYPVDFKILPPLEKNIDTRSSKSLAIFHTEITSLPNEPLVKIRYAKTPTGSALAVNMSHCLVDGYSYFNFLGYWAKYYSIEKFDFKNKLKLTAFYMDMDRSKLCPIHFTDSSTLSQKNLTKADVLKQSGIAWCGERPSCEFEKITWEFIEFSEEELTSLQTQASQHAKLRVSRHDVLTAHLWKLLAQKWNPTSENLSCSSAFDYRRILPTLSPLYFGNAIRPATITEKKEILLNSPLGSIADLIRSSTSRIQKEQVYESLICLDQLRKEKGLKTLEQMHVADPNSGLLVTNLTRFKPELFNFREGAPKNIIPLTPAAHSVVLLKTHKGILARIQKSNAPSN